MMFLYSCATNLGGEGTKLREYMYEGIKFVNEAGAYGNTQWVYIYVVADVTKDIAPEGQMNLPGAKPGLLTK